MKTTGRTEPLKFVEKRESQVAILSELASYQSNSTADATLSTALWSNSKMT